MIDPSQIEGAKAIQLSPGNELTATLTRENAKSLFYMIAGKPDSFVKSFKGVIDVTPTDIKDLYNIFMTKFEHFDGNASVATVDISFHKNKAISFGSWQEFEAHDWSTSDDLTRQVNLKWDFLVNLPNYAIPQRHTVLVKISNEIDPKDIFEIMTSSGPSVVGSTISIDSSVIAGKITTTTCRVDFINNLLGEEIMELVSKWHKSRQRPFEVHDVVKLVDKRRNLLSKIVYYPPFICFGVPGLIVANKFLHNIDMHGPLVAFDFFITISLAVFFICALYFAKKLGKFAKKSFLERLSSSNIEIFHITAADKKQRSHLQRRLESRNSIAIKVLTISLIINILGGLSVFLILKSFGLN